MNDLVAAEIESQLALSDIDECHKMFRHAPQPIDVIGCRGELIQGMDNLLRVLAVPRPQTFPGRKCGLMALQRRFDLRWIDGVDLEGSAKATDIVRGNGPFDSPGTCLPDGPSFERRADGFDDVLGYGIELEISPDDIVFLRRLGASCFPLMGREPSCGASADGEFETVLLDCSVGFGHPSSDLRFAPAPKCHDVVESTTPGTIGIPPAGS